MHDEVRLERLPALLPGRVQKHVALYASFGLMGSRSNGDVSDGDLFTYQTFKSYVANRELFVKLDHLPYNTYVLAGRFNIPYGWRIPDHTSYVRRQLGQLRPVCPRRQYGGVPRLSARLGRLRAGARLHDAKLGPVLAGATSGSGS